MLDDDHELSIKREENHENYITDMCNMLKKVFPEFAEKYQDRDASLANILFFLMGVLGYISTEMITMLYPRSNLASIRTKLNDLIEERMVIAVSIGDTKRHEDSFVNTLYCLSKKGLIRFRQWYPKTLPNDVSGAKRSALHAYYNAFALLAGILEGFICIAEYEDPLSVGKNKYGTLCRRDILKSDAIIIGKNSFALIETDTGYETTQVLLNKIYEYYRHSDNYLSKFPDKQHFTIVFSIREPRVTLAEEPRYKPSMLKVLRDYIEESVFKSHRDWEFSVLRWIDRENPDLSPNKKSTCIEVVNDIIQNSPLFSRYFSIEDFYVYLEDVLSQTSGAYLEDIARIHDKKCRDRIDRLTSIYIRELDRGNIKNNDIEWMLNGMEIYFVSTPRIRSYLPYFFPDEIRYGTCNATLWERRYDWFSPKKDGTCDPNRFHRWYYFEGDEIDPATPNGYVLLRNVYIDGSRVFCFENVDHDLGARIRVRYALKYLRQDKRDISIYAFCSNDPTRTYIKKALLSGIKEQVTRLFWYDVTYHHTIKE